MRVLVLFMLLSTSALAQQSVSPCVQTSGGAFGPNCAPVTASNPLPVVTTGSSIVGNAVAYTSTAVAVPGSSTPVLAANTSAKYRLLQNTSTAASVFIATGTAAALNTGIVLLPQQTFEMFFSSGNIDRRAVNAIASTGTATVLVTEGQ